MRYSYNPQLNSLVRQVTGARYSGTEKCWYIDNDPELIGELFRLLAGKAVINRTEIDEATGQKASIESVINKKKYSGRYRIHSNRLPEWDYGCNGTYFVTICTKNKTPWLGDIRNGKMTLSDAGRAAQEHWINLPAQFPFVKLGTYAFMPEHMHGILTIDKPVSTHIEEISDNINGSKRCGNRRTEAASGKWKAGTLGVIINQYKRICTINIRKTNPDFSWQSRFYDRIILNSIALRRISSYITSNK